MIFKQNYTKTETSFVYYRNNKIQNVSEYTLLGITLKSNGNLSHSTTDLVKKAKKFYNIQKMFLFWCNFA
jgi:hypothetical protein